MSPYGQGVYDDILKKVENREFKDTFISCSVDYSNSGSWFSDQNSKWYNKYENIEENCAGAFNTFYNICITGKLVNDKYCTTSPCIFYCLPTAESDGWCFTKSCSLYCLQKSPVKTE